MSTKATLQTEARRLQKNAAQRRRQATRLAHEEHILRLMLVDVLAAGKDDALGEMVRADIRTYLLRQQRQGPTRLDIGIAEHRAKLETKYLGHPSETGGRE